ncbi:MAG: hypothetical protein IJV19_00280 [Prevotella sp.]|nr:hypothetical protein [Prevotella sp.]
MKKQYGTPEIMTTEIAMHNNLAFGTVTNLENNEDAAAKEYSVWDNKLNQTSLWEEDQEEE